MKLSAIETDIEKWRGDIVGLFEGIGQPEFGNIFDWYYSPPTGPGLGLLGGAMVGETGVLNAASELLLKHCEAIPYIEGIGQNKFILAEDPVVPIPAGEPLAFRLREDLEHTTVISEHKIY